MKKLLLTFVMVLGIVVNGWATTYTGSLTDSSGLFATNGNFGNAGIHGWNPSAVLSYTVDDTTNTGFWTYAYTYTVDEKGISHVIIEVSDDNPATPENEAFTTANLKAGSTAGGIINPYSPSDPGNSNPFMPEQVYGIKWDTEGILSFFWTIVTDRMPMWGDFYAVDGKKPGNEIYAYNTGFGLDTSALIGNGNAMDTQGHAWLLVPDSKIDDDGGRGRQVPEPGTLLLLGSGLIGLALYGGRKFNKKI
ncbi:MAG: hypothetical protein A2W05_00290 [Candidatus Schekmanbacteria bacterium RBG_16_38_10]|uniref:Ice-binding protein C-terminal domain-containing protein n=1 Tax=Candidatus Schekmanbacteria bacterium RBG_16_38_10 TaxID=1817879 RepID=A0A1F7RZ62_9BACT|nr:MAG: hypothetical protein A2W05_00290 [Candidatus Schekmanbacteria bacterium RBG_16_38_10]